MVNIVEPILSHCERQPDAPALCVTGSPHQIISYRWLGVMINNIMRRAIRLGLVRGQVVALFVGDRILQAALILALTRLGIVPISAKGQKLPEGLRVDAVLTDGERRYARVGRVLAVDSTWMMGDGRPIEDLSRHDTRADEVCRIMLTSGTTGDAKAVALSHRMVTDRILRHDDVFGSEFRAYSRFFIDLGFTTSLGFIFLIYTLSRGGTLFRSGDSLEHTLEAFETHRVPAWVGSPGGLANLVAAYEGKGTRQCKLETILSAGSQLSLPLFERVCARMSPRIICIYGSTETSIVATAPAHLIAGTPGAVGYITPGMVVEAVDAEHKPLPSGEEGVIRIRGPYNVKEYLADPMESQEAFRDGWFYPGDTGSVTADKLLMISGRERVVLNLGGNKVNPESIENVLTAFPGVEQAGVFAVMNPYGIGEMRAAIVSNSEFDERQLYAHCQEHLPGQFIPRGFIRAAELPRNEMGKIDRGRLQEMGDQSSTNAPARAAGQEAI